MKVAVLGASPKAERYSNQALHLLQDYSHTVYPIHPQFDAIDGIETYRDLERCPSPIDVLTLYVGAQISEPLAPQIIATKPKLVIFNPGSESEKLRRKLEEVGIATIEACTLVLLRTGQFNATLWQNP